MTIKKPFEFADIVYHVANHDVPGSIIQITEDFIAVRFDKEVTFNPYQKPMNVWNCNPDLLWYTSEDAKANHECQEDPCWVCSGMKDIKDIIT